MDNYDDASGSYPPAAAAGWQVKNQFWKRDYSACIEETNTRANPASPNYTTAPLTPEQIACTFLTIPFVTFCQSTLNVSAITAVSTIPSEIGLVTQLTGWEVSFHGLNSTIQR